MAREPFTHHDKAREFNLTQLEAAGGYSGLFLLSETTWQLAYNLILFYGYWRSRYYVTNEEGEHETIEDDEYETVQDLTDLALEELRCSVACDDLAGLLQTIADAIGNNAGGCGCQGSNGAGLEEPTASGFQDTGVNYPNGYDNRGEYDDAKCDLANLIITRWIQDFQAIKTIEVSGLAVTALAIIIGLLLLTPIAYATLFVFSGLILSLAAGGIGALTTALDEIIARLEAMDICELYSAGTAAQALENVHDWIDGGTYTVDPTTADAAKLLISFGAVNILFDPSPDDLNLAGLDSGDCSSCGDPCIARMITGTGDPYAGGVMYSEEFSTDQWMIRFNTIESYKMTFSALTGWSNYEGSAPNLQYMESWRSSACDGAFPGSYDHENNDSPPQAVLDPASFVVLRSKTEFNVSVLFEEPT
jgi:hypothetical protein